MLDRVAVRRTVLVPEVLPGDGRPGVTDGRRPAPLPPPAPYEVQPGVVSGALLDVYA